MNRTLRTALPYVAAVGVPAVPLAALFAAAGDNALYGLFGGGIGLIGALSALAVRTMLAPQMTESEIEALARELDEQETWTDIRDEPPERG